MIPFALTGRQLFIARNITQGVALGCNATGFQPVFDILTNDSTPEQPVYASKTESKFVTTEK